MSVPIGKRSLMTRVPVSTSSVRKSILKIIAILSAAGVGALTGTAVMQKQFLPLLLILLVAVAAIGARLARHSLPTVSFREMMRWGFLIMLPAATIGSAAAWPTFRTLSVFRFLYLSLAVSAATWAVVKRRFSLQVEVGASLTFLGFWLVWAFASLTWAVDKPASIRYLIFLVMMVSLTVGTLLAVNRLRTLRILLLALLFTFLIAISIGLIETVTGFRLPTSGLLGRVERTQWASTSFFHNQNDFATYIALWLPFALASAFFTRRLWVVAAGAACTLASIVCLLYTGSRTNLIGLILAVLSLLLVITLRKATCIRCLTGALGLAILVGAVLATYFGIRGSLPVLPLPQIGVEHWRFSPLATEIATGTGSGATRVKLVANGLKVLANSSLLGVGPGNAEHYLQQIPGTESVPNLHNWWMEVLVNGGIFVFAGYLFFYASLLYHLFRVAVKAKSRILAYAGTCLFAALAGYTFGALAPSSAVHFTPMWIHFGLGLSVINLYRKRLAGTQV